MDQDSFRQLLSSGSSSQARSQPRESLFTKKNSKASTISANEPAFKPRKVKKSEGKYRDRAAERRDGQGNDYAQVEAVLEEFEKLAEDDVDEKRRYLGGDSEHSVLVKGLDMALLQQNRAKAAMATDEDESLEQAYKHNSAESTVPKKRTREEIIRELKEKRGQGSGAAASTDDLSKNKFKPIGFKPIGGSGEQKEKKKKTKGEGEKKKKKRKIEVPAEENPKEAEDQPKEPEGVPAPSASSSSSRPLPPDEGEPEDFDIFAGAGDYEGLDVGDDSDEDGEVEEKRPDREDAIPSSLGPGRWFATHEPVEGSTEALHDSPPATNAPNSGPSVSHPPPQEVEEGEASDDEPTRLVPLSSSAVPSIKELLELDKAVENAAKKQKRKNKKDVSKKLGTEAKVDRDYQRLKSYTEKRGAPST